MQKEDKSVWFFLLCTDSGASFFYRQCFNCLYFPRKKNSQESEFCGGQVEEPEIFFSTGKTILERFVFRRLISTNAFLNLTKSYMFTRDTIFFISERAL